MPISRQEVAKVASLARLALSDDELDRMTSQLGSIVGFVSQLEALDTAVLAQSAKSGGGALSDTWAQIMADVLDIPIHQQADPRNGNVLGIAFLAFLRLGRIRLDDIPGMVRIAKVFQPNPENRAVYDRLFAQFMACQKKLTPVFHALNRD